MTPVTLDRILAALQDRVTYSLDCLAEEDGHVGRCSAINAEVDQETEDWIDGQLQSGNRWAWFCAKVTAEFQGAKGTDYLGHCSYKSEEDFRAPGGYFDDMKDAALRQLAETLLKDYTRVRELLG